MKQLEMCSGRRGSTAQVHHKYIRYIDVIITASVTEN